MRKSEVRENEEEDEEKVMIQKPDKYWNQKGRSDKIHTILKGNTDHQTKSHRFKDGNEQEYSFTQ